MPPIRRASQVELPLGLETYRNTSLFSDHFLSERLPEMGWYRRGGSTRNAVALCALLLSRDSERPSRAALTLAWDEQQRSEPGLSALSLCARSERLARTQQGPRAARPPASAPQPLPRSPPKLGGGRGVHGRTQSGRRAEGYGAQNGRRPLGGDRRRPRGNRIERRRAFEPQAAISRSCSSDRRGHLDRDRELWLAGSLAL